MSVRVHAFERFTTELASGCARTAMEEMVAPRRHTTARARQSKIFSTTDARRFNHLSACICVHLLSIFLADRPSAQKWEAVFMVEHEAPRRCPKREYADTSRPEQPNHWFGNRGASERWTRIHLCRVFVRRTQASRYSVGGHGPGHLPRQDPPARLSRGYPRWQYHPCCVVALLPTRDAQILTYLRMSQIPVGLLMNFHAIRLKDGLQHFVI
jgi:hypothetical protein